MPARTATRCLCSLAVGCLGVAPMALAQSGVSIYGNLDLGINKESGSPARMERGYNNWLGVKGREELGGGLASQFHLQARFAPDTGRPERTGTFFQGESTVGLDSMQAGTLRLGRALTPLWQDVWAFEPWKNSGFNGSLAAYQTGSYSSDGVNDAALDYANFSRFGNSVFYASPKLGGLHLHVASELERAPLSSARATGATLNYARGALAGMASYERNAAGDTIGFFGAAWQLEKLTLMGSHARVNAGGMREQVYVLAGTYAIGKDSLRAGYGRNRQLGSHKFSTGYVHALSPRTDLYTDLYREQTGTRKKGVAIGISHNF